MNEMNQHQSVLLKEATRALNIKADGVYVDGTFGRGGHSREILQALGPKGRLIAIDKDLDAIEYGKAHFKDENRLKLCHGSFVECFEICRRETVEGLVDGILLDLGISSPQIDIAERGFSFMNDGPLDMRMDKTQKLDAQSFINQASVADMVSVFRDFGEERYALRIAKAIEKEREELPITTTKELAEIVKKAHPKWEKHKHPATRVFQAIRIHVNQELTDLGAFLEQAIKLLKPGGRLAVISFHSLEDRMVKQFMRREERGEVLPKSIAVRMIDKGRKFRRIGRAIKPNDTEIEGNIRARSAVLRIGEKL